MAHENESIENDSASRLADSQTEINERNIRVSEPSEETQLRLVNDYAPLTAIIRQLDQQVSSFAVQMERFAYKAAPSYEGLTEKWTQEAALSKGDDGASA
jgi:hypothetical protein